MKQAVTKRDLAASFYFFLMILRTNFLQLFLAAALSVMAIRFLSKGALS